MVCLAAMFFSILAVACCTVLNLPPYSIGIRRIRLNSVEDFSFSSPSYTIAIHKILLSLHRPCSTAPYWAIITADEYIYCDNESVVSIDKVIITLWFFPVFFRHTAGPWITTVLDGLCIRVFTSERSPRWITLIRDNVYYTILDGDTIRLHYLKTRIQFSDPAGPVSKNRRTGKIGKTGLLSEGRRGGMQLQVQSSQWHIVNLKRRMYTFGDVELTLQKNWIEDHGTVLLRFRHCRWTKMSAPLARQEGHRRESAFWQIFRGIYCFPINFIKTINDPLSTVDIVVQQCDLEFLIFRIRDADLLCQAMMKINRESQKIQNRHPGLLQSIASDVFIRMLRDTFTG